MKIDILQLITTVSVLILFFMNPPKTTPYEDAVLGIALPRKFEQWFLRRKMKNQEYIGEHSHKYWALWYLIKYPVVWTLSILLNLLALWEILK